MSEIKALQVIDDALGALEPAERVRVLSWAQQKYGTSGQVNTSTSQQAPAPAQSVPLAKTPVNGTKAKASKKSKTIISMDKNLNLNPAGKTSAVQFATEKSPSTVVQKCVVGLLSA
jgi:hypothetical protein